MKFRQTTLAPLLVCVMLAAPVLAAAKGKGSNIDFSRATATSLAVEAVETVRTADALARYGDARKDPLALIEAAKMKKEAGEQPLQLVRKGRGEAGTKTSHQPDYSADALLARARALSAGQAGLLALADEIAKNEDHHADRGPKAGHTVVKAGFTDQFVFRFSAGVPAAVAISGDGDSTLDLYVYDEYGNRICAAVGRGDDAVCRWTPKWTGVYTVRVLNHGAANEYTIRTQ